MELVANQQKLLAEVLRHFCFCGGAFLLASSSLISTVNGYENYIQVHGIDEQVMDAMAEPGVRWTV